MQGKTFADTNIVVYAYSQSEADKRNKAIAVLDNSHLVVSTQVLREFISVAIHKYNMPLDEVMVQIAEIANAAEIVYEDMELFTSALRIYEQYGYRFYDCLIISAALKADCAVLLSEDMQSGQVIDGKLTILNPFI